MSITAYHAKHYAFELNKLHRDKCFIYGLRYFLAADILSRTRQDDPAIFEQLLVGLLLAMGYSGIGAGMAHTLRKTGDNGVDGIINQDPFSVDQVYIQAKHYAKGINIAAGEARDFFGVLDLKKPRKAFSLPHLTLRHWPFKRGKD